MPTAIPVTTLARSGPCTQRSWATSLNRKATDERTAEQDAEAARRDLDDSIAWTEGGDNALTGTHDGKQAVGELWGQLMSKGFRTMPHDFVAEGDKVVVLTTASSRARRPRAPTC